MASLEESGRLHHEKAWKFFESLGSPRYVCAPMVNGSELPFRALCRENGTTLAYTPMYHAACFLRDHHFQSTFTTDEADRPLFVQFCANDPQTLLNASHLVENKCDAIDLNFGCPQGIARRGNYGAFLLNQVPLMCSLVSILHQHLSIPVTCKIRILPSFEETLHMCLSLQQAGCTILTVHGRTKEQNKHLVGSCNFDVIRRIKEAMSIPVFLNGGVETLDDAKELMELTGVDAVMSAEGLLSNPALFSERPLVEQPTELEMADRYLELVRKYPHGVADSFLRGHLFKMLYKSLCVHTDIRNMLGSCKRDTMMQIPDLIRKADAVIDPAERAQRLSTTPNWYMRHRQKELAAAESGEGEATEEEEEAVEVDFEFGCLDLSDTEDEDTDTEIESE